MQCSESLSHCPTAHQRRMLFATGDHGVCTQIMPRKGASLLVRKPKAVGGGSTPARSSGSKSKRKAAVLSTPSSRSKSKSSKLLKAVKRTPPPKTKKGKRKAATSSDSASKAPKRARTAWIIFTQAERKRLQAAGTLNQSTFFKEASITFKGLSAEDKEKYEEEARKDKVCSGFSSKEFAHCS